MNLERDINIAVDGPFWVEVANPEHPFLQRLAKRCGCLLSYSQAEPGRELMQPRKHLLAEPCRV